MVYQQTLADTLDQMLHRQSSEPLPFDLAVEFRRSYQWLVKRLWNKLSCRFDAEDIASSSFMEVAVLAQSHHIRQPRALLTTISTRMVYDLWRRRTIERTYLEQMREMQEVHALSEEQLYELFERISLIDKALEQLPEKTREAFMMSQIDGLKHRAIAECMGISVSMVRKHLTKAFTACYLASEG
ncbi:sigma-70 family RNA polymerase sigma factor [Frateuria aurantia]